MSTSTKSDRPNRLVVILGIATVVLFSANLLSMISQRVWPKLQDVAGFGSSQQVDELAPLASERIHIYSSRNSPAVYTFSTTSKRKHRCKKGHDHADVEIDIEHSLDSDMSRLEREIEFEMQRLNSELSEAEVDIENAISLKLHLGGDEAILVNGNRLDLSDLESKIEGMAKKFELRVREHEAAAKKNRIVMKEGSF